jgi:hypothetical protein
MSRISYSHSPLFGIKHHQLEEDEVYDILRPGYNIYTAGIYKGMKNGHLQFFNNRPARHTMFEVKPSDEMRFKLKKKNDRWINISSGGRPVSRRSRTRRRKL